MTSKPCFKCGEVQPLSHFYKHGMMADGHLNKCKTCTKRDVQKNRKDKIDYYRAYDRARGNRRSLEDCRRYRRNNPEKYIAHTAVNNAIRDGKLKRPEDCENCGQAGLIHGHHDDYSKPLEVRWLCPACHHGFHDRRP